ncbi:hypothetical protein LCGC14_0275270 [marine sediment metagenome]|uniref:Uncharacterized protein n=1 Tax=marine sediment metagenome TaxID=412755 RepID=A0A0F9UEC3_9ZZZZ
MRPGSIRLDAPKTSSAVVKREQKKRFEQVQVEFLLDIMGARSFPLPSRRKYRFDAGARKRVRMPRQDADELVRRFGKTTFKILS